MLKWLSFNNQRWLWFINTFIRDIRRNMFILIGINLIFIIKTFYRITLNFFFIKILLHFYLERLRIFLLLKILFHIKVFLLLNYFFHIFKLVNIFSKDLIHNKLNLLINYIPHLFPYILLSHSINQLSFSKFLLL